MNTLYPTKHVRMQTLEHGRIDHSNAGHSFVSRFINNSVGKCTRYTIFVAFRLTFLKVSYKIREGVKRMSKGKEISRDVQVFGFHCRKYYNRIFMFMEICFISLNDATGFMV